MNNRTRFLAEMVGVEPTRLSRDLKHFECSLLRPLEYISLLAVLHSVQFIIAKFPATVNAQRQNRRCLRVGVGSKGVSSWWRRMNTCRVFSTTVRPLCLGTE